MLRPDLKTRKHVYDLNLIDRRVYDKKNNNDFLDNTKHAKLIYLRTRSWKKVTHEELAAFISKHPIISSGLVAIGHRKKTLYTQYCVGLLCEPGKHPVDVEFYLEFNDDFTLKKN